MSPISALFGTASIFYGLFLPVMLMQLLALILIPALIRPGTKVHEAAKATYSYLAQSIGILLMTAGSLPALYSVLSSQSMSGGSYTALLVIFAVGGITFLAHDAIARTVEPPSRIVPATVFYYTWKLLGLILALFAGLSFVLRLITMSGTLDERWWVSHIVVLVYGLVLSWFTSSHHYHLPTGFNSTSLQPAAPAMAAKGKKPVVMKKK